MGRSGCGVSSVLTVLLLLSVSLNVALLSGCKALDGLCAGLRGDNRPKPVAPAVQVYDATEDLRAIASKLGVETQGKNAAELASAIQAKIYADVSAKGFPKDLLSAEQVKEVNGLVPAEKGKIISAYQDFIKSLEGKHFLIVP